MLIPLVCTQCGGKLEAEKTQVIESGNMFIVLSGQTLKCPHCETKFVSGDKIKRFSEQPVISIGGRVTDSQIIVGNGVVMGNGVVIINNPSPKTSQDNQEEE